MTTSSTSKKLSYNGNPNLKQIGTVISYSAEQVKEIIKCGQNPIYFIENYCKIVSLDKGLIPFKLYDCKKEKVDMSDELFEWLDYLFAEADCFTDNNELLLRRPDHYISEETLRKAAKKVLNAIEKISE